MTSALDAMVKIWDVPTGTCAKTVWSKGGLKSPLSYAALVNRGTWLLTSYEDGCLQVGPCVGVDNPSFQSQTDTLLRLQRVL